MCPKRHHKDGGQMPTTGLDLKVKRTRANVKLRDLADAMQLSRQSLWSLERAALVPADRVSQYLAALETCRNVKTQGEAA